MDFVPVLFAPDEAEAQFYKALLEDYGITVIIPEGDHEEGLEQFKPTAENRGIAILVPEESLSDAKDIIERQGNEGDPFDPDHKDDDDELAGFDQIDPDQQDS